VPFLSKLALRRGSLDRNSTFDEFSVRAAGVDARGDS
jgi:hypothetical protein